MVKRVHSNNKEGNVKIIHFRGYYTNCEYSAQNKNNCTKIILTRLWVLVTMMKNHRRSIHIICNDTGTLYHLH